MAIDLTLLFITANLVPEKWAEYHKEVLLKAAGDYPIITISRRQTPIGTNILEDEHRSISNIYKQMLRAAKLATTDYVAMVEDDTLYTRDHFTNFRPTKDAFAYNMNHWSLFTWGEPMYNYRYRMVNSCLIAPRLYLIDALEERFAKFPEGTPHNMTGELGRRIGEKQLGLAKRNSVRFDSRYAIINFNHDNSSEEWQRTHVKRPGHPRAYDIPYWGRAEELVKKFV